MFQWQLEDMFAYTVDLQWFEHLMDHETIFETGLVLANEC